jgi:hypothetical protein
MATLPPSSLEQVRLSLPLSYLISLLGFTLDDLRETGFSLGNGVYAGFTIEELRDSGGIALSVLAAQRKIDGVSASSMASDGFTFLELQEAGYDLYGMLNSHLDSVLCDATQCLRLLFEQERDRSDSLDTALTSPSSPSPPSTLPIDHRIIDPLIEILSTTGSSTSDTLLLCTAQTLGVLATSTSLRSLITLKTNTICVLVDLLRNESIRDDCKEAVTWVLRNLCIDNPRNMTAIALAGAIDPLVDQLLYGSDSYKIAAANALCNLACDNSNTAAITSAGAITPLVDLLSHADVRSALPRLS